jgi:hypothetical protein
VVGDGGDPLEESTSTTSASWTVAEATVTKPTTSRYPGKEKRMVRLQPMAECSMA